MKALVSLSALIITFQLCLCSCAKDLTGRKLLEESLYSDYTKEASYIISDGEKTNEGTLILTRGDVSTLEFTSPDTLSGIFVTSDETGKENSYSISFDGISTDVPKSLLGKISLMFLLTSDDVASRVKNLKKEDCSALTDKDILELYSGYVPYTAKLRLENVSVIITYDSTSGEILTMCASSGDDSATLNFHTQK